MFGKSLPGFTDYQIGYVREHTKNKKDSPTTRIVGWVAKLVLLITTVGIWLCVLQPETTHEAVSNMALFGVVVLVFTYIFVFFLILFSLVCVLGADLIRSNDSGASALLIDADTMMANRNLLHNLCTSWGKEIKMFLWRVASLAFFAGMVAHGYILAPLIVAITTILAVWAVHLVRVRTIKSVKELTPERVAELEVAFQQAEEDKKDKAEVAALTIDVPCDD